MAFICPSENAELAGYYEFALAMIPTDPVVSVT
jgi:hypothetical protein